MRLPYLPMPRVFDPRRHNDVRRWAEGEHVAARLGSQWGWRERAVYGAMGIGLLVVAVAALVRLL